MYSLLPDRDNARVGKRITKIFAIANQKGYLFPKDNLFLNLIFLFSNFSKMDLQNFSFSPIKESDVAKEMTQRYMQDMLDYAESDIIIIGAGPSGLAAAYELSKTPNLKIAIIEASVAPGGGGWIGGQLFSSMIVRKPAHEFLNELEIPYDEKENYVVIKHAALYTSTILSKLIRNGVKLFNAVAVEDLIIKEGKVCGVVTNWAPVTKAHGTQSCMDPNVMEAKIVISTTGHDGPFAATGVKRLAQLGMIEIKGMKALDMNKSEDGIVANTKEIVPGMILAGMEVSEAYGIPRMGATFGAMFVSGIKAARIALEKLK